MVLFPMISYRNPSFKVTIYLLFKGRYLRTVSSLFT